MKLDQLAALAVQRQDGLLLFGLRFKQKSSHFFSSHFHWRQQYRFFELDLIDFDAEKLVCKLFIVHKSVAVVDVFASGVLLQHSRFTAR